MARLYGRAHQLLRAVSFPRAHASTPRVHASTAAATRMNGSPLFEEEKLPWYNADQFYPVRMGEIFVDKYKVVGKLGYGVNSTVWLCKDLQSTEEFVAIKVCTRDVKGSVRTEKELKFYEHIDSLRSQHPGQAYIRGLFETFKLNGPAGNHVCFVQPPMHMTVRELQRQNPSARLNKQLLNWTLHNVFNALAFLHDEAKVVHTDINPFNIMLTVDDKSLLTEFQQAEAENPSPVKIIDQTRTIYGSRKFGRPKNMLWGQPVLCDFGEARIGLSHKGLIQPELYRAPEVLFDMEWHASVDIWTIPVLIWDLFEGRHLFQAQDEQQEPSASHHIAEMVAYLGLPPIEYLRRSEATSNVFDEQGQWDSDTDVEVPNLSLESAETVLIGNEKATFLSFIREMLRWLPEERLGATQLLAHPWLEGAIPK